MNPIKEAAARVGAGQRYFELWWRYKRNYEPNTEWCQRHKAFFIHIPKTAGTSLIKSLDIPKLGYTHVPVRILERLYPREIEDYFVFSVVRNPWDRLVSSYEYTRQVSSWDKQRGWAERNIGGLNFTAFLRRLESSPRYRRAIMGYEFFFPQSYFLTRRDGRIRADLIIKYEQLAEGHKRLLEHFPDAAPLGHSRKNTQRRAYQDYYTEETRDIVAALYRNDIRNFSYEF